MYSLVASLREPLSWMQLQTSVFSVLQLELFLVCLHGPSFGLLDYCWLTHACHMVHMACENCFWSNNFFLTCVGDVDALIAQKLALSATNSHTCNKHPAGPGCLLLERSWSGGICISIRHHYRSHVQQHSLLVLMWALLLIDGRLTNLLCIYAVTETSPCSAFLASIVRSLPHIHTWIVEVDLNNMKLVSHVKAESNLRVSSIAPREHKLLTYQA